MNIKGHLFYNKSQKEAYLETMQNEREKCDLTIAFNQIASLEEQFGVDISDADQTTLMLILRLWEVSSYCRYKRFTKLLNQYVEYAVNNGYSKQVTNVFSIAIKQVEYNVTASIYSNYVKEPKDLIDVLTNLFGSHTVKSRYIFHIAFLVLLYNGFEEQEVLQLCEEDIDMSAHKIKDIKIYDEFWSVVVNALATQTVVTRRGQIVEVPLEQTSSIIKYIVNDFIKVVREDLYRKKRDSNNIPKGLSLSTIKTSGKWFKFYMDEKAGVLPWDKLFDYTDYKNYKKAYWM